MKTLKKNWKIIIFCFGLSLLFLTICSKTSFLYSFHDWFDSNAFLTMGRGMKHGLIPYRDLFEQKGPILYFLHMIAAFISETSFIGVWILQIISFTIFLFYAYKTISLYLPEKASYYLLPLLTFFVFMMKSYRYGDSAEEFCLPLLMISLYDLLLYTKEKKELPSTIFLKNGIIAGIVLWIKYSLIGFWFGFIVFFFFYLIIKKEYKNAFINALVFLSGMIIVSIPIFIYFGLNKSIIDLVDCYFLVNIKNYTISFSFLERIIWLIQTLVKKFYQEYMITFLILIGCYFINKRQQKTKVAFFCCLFFLILSVYGGGRAYSYYFLIFAPFSLLGLIFIYQKTNIKNVNKSFVFLIICTTFFLAENFQHNTIDLTQNKDDFAQYQFAKIINNKKQDASILNYGFLDGGFYLTTHTLPNLKYFQKNNIPYTSYPINLQAQKEVIDNKMVDFVILFIKKGQILNDVLFPSLENNYHVISQKKQKIEGKIQTYYLLEKNNS